MEYYSFYFSRIIGECEDSKLLRKKQEHCQSISPSRFWGEKYPLSGKIMVHNEWPLSGDQHASLRYVNSVLTSKPKE